MSLNDPISDMLTRVRNAATARHETVTMPYSRLKGEIARILKSEGYVQDFTTEAQDGQRALRVYLKYGQDHQPVICGLKRISSPGCRKYVGAKQVPRVLGGLGIAIVSTSKGLVSDREARKIGIGGEVMCHVW